MTGLTWTLQTALIVPDALAALVAPVEVHGPARAGIKDRMGETGEGGTGGHRGPRFRVCRPGNCSLSSVTHPSH